jgi:hypothetical protein
MGRVASRGPRRQVDQGALSGRRPACLDDGPGDLDDVRPGRLGCHGGRGLRRDWLRVLARGPLCRARLRPLPLGGRGRPVVRRPGGRAGPDVRRGQPLGPGRQGMGPGRAAGPRHAPERLRRRPRRGRGNLRSGPVLHGHGRPLGRRRMHGPGPPGGGFGRSVPRGPGPRPPRRGPGCPWGTTSTTTQ